MALLTMTATRKLPDRSTIFPTATSNLPVSDKSEVGTLVVKIFSETKVVFNAVPLIITRQSDEKPSPFTVSTKGDPDNGATDCERPGGVALSELMEGIGRLVTTKLLNTCDVPFGVVTVSVRGPEAVPERILTVIGSDVAVPPVPIVAVTPAPLNATLVAPSRLVPLMTAETDRSGAPAFGYIAVTDGALDCAAAGTNPNDMRIRRQQYPSLRTTSHFLLSG